MHGEAAPVRPVARDSLLQGPAFGGQFPLAPLQLLFPQAEVFPPLPDRNQPLLHILPQALQLFRPATKGIPLFAETGQFPLQLLQLARTAQQVGLG